MYRLTLVLLLAASLFVASCSSTSPARKRRPLDNMHDYGLDQTINIRASKSQVAVAKAKGIDLPIGNYRPSKMVAPVYPLGAMNRMEAGWVLVSYTVTETGGLEDIRVVDEYPRGRFANSALKAAEQFQFEPYVENGVPIRIPNAWNIFTYEIY